MTITSTGFIAVQPGYAVLGAGRTEAEALADAHECAESVDDLVCLPATPALVDLVRNYGGFVAWDKIDGIACTIEEAETA